MSHTCHHAILVTTYSRELAMQAHAYALSLFDPLMVSEIRDTPRNGFASFAVFPDGSGDGWDVSDENDVKREYFRGWLNDQRYEDRSCPYDWVEVEYGDDSSSAMIVADSNDYMDDEEEESGEEGSSFDLRQNPYWKKPEEEESESEKKESSPIIIDSTAFPLTFSDVSSSLVPYQPIRPLE